MRLEARVQGSIDREGPWHAHRPTFSKRRKHANMFVDQYKLLPFATLHFIASRARSLMDTGYALTQVSVSYIFLVG